MMGGFPPIKTEQSKMDLHFKNSRINIFVIFLLVFLTHINIFGNQFVMDDFDYIVNWPLIHDIRNWPQFFVDFIPHPRQPGIYSPLKTLFHSINYQLFGLNPLGYHVVSLLIHFVCVGLVYFLARRLSGEALTAFFSALIFGLHPLHVESITYMTASIDMIGIAFLFASFYLYVQSCQGRFNKTHYLGSLMLACLAVFTHELAISLPVLFLWYELTLNHAQDTFKSKFSRCAPFFLVVFCYAFCKYLVLGSVTRGEYIHGSFYLTMLVMIKAMAKYVLICVAPFVLTHNQVISRGIYSFDQEDFDPSAVYAQSFFDGPTSSVFFTLVIICYLAVRFYKSKSLAVFCAGWFFISLLPVMNIIPSGVYFAERYLYPGMFAFSFLLAWGLFCLIKKQGWMKYAAVAFVICLTVFYSVRTLWRNRDWRDDMTIFESAVRANPRSALMRTDLGIIYTRYQRPDKAIESFQKALAIRPDNPVTYFAMAEAFIQSGENQKAKEVLQRAVSLNSEYAQAYYNLAGLYALEKNMTEAKINLDKALLFYRKHGQAQEAEQLQKAFEEFFVVR